jgi:flagellar biosynthesis chaperone FliJ
VNEHDYQRFLSDAEGCESETSTPGALTREQVEDHCNMLADANVDWPGRESLSEALLDHDAALRATITQQAQELERVKKLMKEREYRDEANATLQLQILADKAKRIDDLKQQLSASQARCRELEREIKSLTTCGCEGCDDNLEESAFCLPCMNKVQQQVTQLQATLAAREARVRELEDQMNAKRYVTNETL